MMRKRGVKIGGPFRWDAFRIVGGIVRRAPVQAALGRLDGLYCCRVDFRITHHSGSGAPEDALERLWQVLETRGVGVRFGKRGSEIRATLPEDDSVSLDSDARAQVGRRAVLDIVREVCESAPELELHWYAVSVLR